MYNDHRIIITAGPSVTNVFINNAHVTISGDTI